MGSLIITASGSGAATESVTSWTDAANGVTYTFGSAVDLGTYWNGQPFVLSNGGDITITSITPGSQTITDESLGTGKVYGTQVNPIVKDGFQVQGFESRVQNGNYAYSDSLNVDPANTSTDLVIDHATYPNGASVVKAVSDIGTGDVIENFSVLTIVPEVPPVNAFRPAITAVDKRSPWAISDLDYTVLQSLAPVAGQSNITAFSPTWKDVVNLTWSELGDGNGILIPSRAGHPGYAARFQDEICDALANLHSNYTNQQKAELFASVVQWGLDILETAKRNDMNWPRNWTKLGDLHPIATVAAVALNDAALKAIVGRSDSTWPETFLYGYVNQSDVDNAGDGTNWNKEPLYNLEHKTGEIGKPWGFPGFRPSKGSQTIPYYGSHNYVTPCVGLLLEMLGSPGDNGVTAGEGRTIWNNEAFFDNGTKMARVHEVSPDIYEGSTSYAPNAFMLNWIAAYEATYSSTSTQFVPERIEKGMTLTPGATTIDVTAASIILPGSSAVTQLDLRHSTDGTNWTEINDCGTTYQITGLSPSTLYYVQMRARNAAGTGEWSHHVWKFRRGQPPGDILTRLINAGIVDAETDAGFPVPGDIEDAANSGARKAYINTAAWESHLDAIITGVSAYRATAAEVLEGAVFTTA